MNAPVPHAESAPDPLSKAQLFVSQLTAELLLAERLRQVAQEGYAPDHDDRHNAGELAEAAACYCHSADAQMHGVSPEYVPLPREWPWHPNSYKPRSPREDLVRAGALILAELERLSRAEAAKRMAAQGVER